MFADDAALSSDTVSWLQSQLNILKSFCDNFKLSVNVEKTKVVVFKRGGNLAAKEKCFFLNGNRIETVNGFTYVGIYFNNRLSFF